ncbi:Farnesoate epoxidase [Orchesella cincta]|uniref:Farnesoate epoxidase n=1 Tax=Orchesella cincta TaxID=48709 RepID=A0A1D2N9M1_ORCCI|nr:Farnesoate epoxidase [Orchesella cincta]
MFSITVWIFIVVAVLAYFVLKPKKRTINLPGPWGLPIVGNAFQIGKRMHITMAKWGMKYGPMCKVKLGPMEVVVISDQHVAKEMLAMDAFVGRTTPPEFVLYEGETVGIIGSEGELWEQQRRFVVRQLRDFGFGKSSMESIIMEEVNELGERLAAFKGEPITNMKSFLSLATVNSLWSIVAGTRYSQDDPKLRALAHRLSGAFNDAGENAGALFLMKWLKHIAPEFCGYNGIRRMFADLAEFVSKTIQEHKNTFQEDSPRDFIDVYLKEIKSTTDPSSSFHGAEAAGADTMASTLNWAILHIINNPEILRKLQAEIKEVTGNSRPVSFSDRPKMPYTLAMINEMLRLTLSPFGVPHCVLNDTEYKGVFLPKGTIIMINLHFLHHDPRVWGDPENFRPERFLTPNEKSLVKNEYLNPFMVGRRQCPGESLARDTIFLFLVNLVQKFDILKEPSSEVDLEPEIGFLLQPKPYKAVFLERKL